MEESTVLTELRDDGVAVVTLNRPERLNAFDQAMFDRMPEAFAEVAGAAAVVVTGAGAGFSAGADILSTRAWPQPADATDWMRAVGQAVLTLHALPAPTIAAIHGATAGGGLGLALACDIRLAGPAATFRAPFSRMGLVPDFGCTWLLPRAVGEARALELCLSARIVGPDEAVAIGLATRQADDPLAAALELAASIAALPDNAARDTKALLRAGAEVSLETSVLELEAHAQGTRLAAPAFAERRAAWFAAKGKR